jgi:DNA polymerase III epsilon subunit-like protein
MDIYPDLIDRNKLNTRFGLPWSILEEKLLIESIINNLNIDDIAKKHGRNFNSIELKLTNLISNNKLSIDTIINNKNISIDTINNRLQNSFSEKKEKKEKKETIKPVFTGNSLDVLINKNIIIFDLETSGLPKMEKGYNYPYYKKLDMYDSSRIVSIGWTYIKNYTGELLEFNKINENIVKPENFIISEEVSKIHGITHEFAIKNGIPLPDILRKAGLREAINDADYLVAHNCLFDLNILLSECYRLLKCEIEFVDIVKKLNYMLYNNKYVCTLKYSRATNKIKKHNLTSIYNHFFCQNPPIAHTAKADVDSLSKVLYKMIKDEDRYKNYCIKNNLDNFEDLDKFIVEMENNINY